MLCGVSGMSSGWVIRLMKDRSDTAMIELDHVDSDLYSKATAALENRETLIIRVRQKSSEAVKKAISLDAKYFALRQAGKNDRLLLAQFGWYAIRTPSLWGVLNKARLMNLDVNTYEENGELFLTIKNLSADKQA